MLFPLNILQPSDRMLPPDAAIRLLAACVAEFELLKTFDSEAVTLDLEDVVKVARSDELRAAWDRWADGAAAALDRVKDDPSIAARERQKFAGMIRHARYIARCDREELRRRKDRVEAGEYVSREEARRELGLPHRR